MTHPHMRIVRLHIEGFRGIDSLTIDLNDHCVLVGANGSGKSTIIDSLSLLFGRDRFVRQLTEHDFHGGDPSAATRIRLIATLAFDTPDPAKYAQWFREGRAVPKWWDEKTRSISAEPKVYSQVCAQIAYAACFDCDALEVESRRYFHDDDGVKDVFVDESIVGVPTTLLGEIGLLVIPALRTRDRVLSFSGETFRRLVATTGGIPAGELLAERNRLRAPATPIEDSKELTEIVKHLDEELGRLLARRTKFQLRIDGTNSESLLRALVTHYVFDDGISLPVGNHGTGLLSLQTMLLLMELCQARRAQGRNIILALEEPELHLPPGLQRRVVHQAIAAANQTITTTHSPRVAALYGPENVKLLIRSTSTLRAEPLVQAPLEPSAPNGIRRLLHDNREVAIEALMQPWLLVPEGRTDYEWLRLLSDRSERRKPGSSGSPVPFGAVVGVIPTHDAALDHTIKLLAPLRAELVALVDGDSAGDGYVKTLQTIPTPPAAILQWPPSWTIEDVVHWITTADWKTFAIRLSAEGLQYGSSNDFLADLRTTLKTDYLAHETIASAIFEVAVAADRADSVLGKLRDAITAPHQSGPTTAVVRIIV